MNFFVKWNQANVDAHNLRIKHELKPGNLQTVCAKAAPISQHGVVGGPPEAKPGKAQSATRYLVCIESRECRLKDPDNVFPKWSIDFLRYAKVIPDDSERFITPHVTQVKVKTKAEEGHMIVVLIITPELAAIIEEFNQRIKQFTQL